MQAFPALLKTIFFYFHCTLFVFIILMQCCGVKVHFKCPHRAPALFVNPSCSWGKWEKLGNWEAGKLGN